MPVNLHVDAPGGSGLGFCLFGEGRFEVSEFRVQGLGVLRQNSHPKTAKKGHRSRRQQMQPRDPVLGGSWVVTNGQASGVPSPPHPHGMVW